MAVNKTIIIISTQVDATVKEYQPDVEFLIFKSLEQLGNYIDTTPIRAKSLYFTNDVVGALNSSFSYLRNLVNENDYLSVDEVIYLTTPDAPELKSLEYLINENELKNWEIITGSMTRSFITEVINGTFRDENLKAKYKAVYRRPRADYVKQKLRQHDSLDEEYEDDESYLADIPDEPIPELAVTVPDKTLQKVPVAGFPSIERTVFTFLAAQYMALDSKVIIVESDPDYHQLTEITTKTDVKAQKIDIKHFYEDPETILEALKNTEENLIIFECIERYKFDYNFLINLLYYKLNNYFDYILIECDFTAIPYNTPFVCTLPNTVIGCLQTGELLDRVYLPFCQFVGIDMKSLPDIHISNGKIMANILNDVMSANDITCTILTVSHPMLNAQAYDLGAVFKGGII